MRGADKAEINFDFLIAPNTLHRSVFKYAEQFDERQRHIANLI